MRPILEVRLSLRLLARDWRGGELGILAIALVIAVASITSVGFFTDRVRQGMVRQAGELLAADLVLESPDPIPVARRAEAAALGLATATTLSFRSVVLAGQRTQLVEVKAVGPGYPLRGRVRIAATSSGPDHPATGIPPRGQVWVEPRLLPLLGLKPGARLDLGDSHVAISAILRYEPDRGGGFFSIAPRVLMNLADVPATGLLGPGSRVGYRLLLAGDPARLRRYRHWLAAHPVAGERVMDVEEGRPELSTALARARRFLGLAALVSVVLAGVAVATAARRFSLRRRDPVAVMRALGATHGTVLRSHALEFLWLGLGASAAGCVLGYGAQAGLVEILGRLLLADLPGPGPWPALSGVLTGLLTLLGFALPPLLALGRVPPARVLRRDAAPPAPQAWLVYGAACGALAVLMAWQAEDLKLAAWLLVGTAGTLLALGAAAWALVAVLRGLRGQVGVAWRFGAASIARRARASVVQIVAFGLGLMILLLLSVVRTDLLEGWRHSLPADAPNHFLINIQPDQRQAVRDFFRAEGLPPPVLYPMVRARLVARNGKPIGPQDYTEERARRLVAREFNLSWSAAPQGDNKVVAGRWWTAADAGRPLLSLEKGLADTLGLHLGDRLRFLIGGQDLTVTVSNLRQVEWDSFRVNFFAVLPPGVLDAYPATWITSFHLDPDRRDLLPALVARFPSITDIDVAALMARVRSIMDRVVLAVEYVFGFTLLAGLAVLYAAIQASQDERRYEYGVLRTLGAGRHLLLRGLAAEFTLLGGLAGLLAGAGATAVGWLLAARVFGFPFQPTPWPALIGLGVGAVGVGLAGVLGTRGVLAQPPLRTLREL